MDVGIPHSLLTQSGEIVFNDLTGDATSASLAGDVGQLVWPGPGVHPDFPDGLPDGNGYMMQFLSGMHGAPIRATVDNRPHKHGGIVHRFYSGPKYFTLDGLIVGDTPEIRSALYDILAGWVFNSMQVDARHFFKPPSTTLGTRFHTVRNYVATDIVGPGGSPGGSPAGVAGPKQYTAEFVAVNPFAYTYTETDTTITDEGTVPNNGTVETWPVIEVYAGASEMVAFELSDDNGFTVLWNGHVAAGHFIEVNMFNESMYLDRNSTNKLAGLDDDSDFFSIRPGGSVLQILGADHILVKTNDAWV